MSQGSYHRNSAEGEWNWPIDQNAGPDKKGEDFIDWKMWLGGSVQAVLRRRPLLPLPQILGLLGRHRDRPVLPRGGAAEHLLGPSRSSRTRSCRAAAIYVFKDEREVPDTFHLIARIRQGPLGRADVLDGQLAAHPGPHPRPRRHHHHGGARPVRGPHDHITLKPERRIVGKNAEYKAEVRLRRQAGRQDRSRGSEGLHDRARGQLPGVHAHAPEADARRGNRRLRAGADHHGRAVLTARARCCTSTRRTSRSSIGRPGRKTGRRAHWRDSGHLSPAPAADLGAPP